MKKWYAFETGNWDIIGALEKQLGPSSVLSRLLAGRTQPRERGNEMAESIFSLDNVKVVDQALSDLVRRKGVLVYSDQVAWFYRYNGDIYVLPPMKEELGTWEPLEQPTSDWDSLRADHLDAVAYQMDVQQGIIEAGFATEPLRHALQDLYECMYTRMLSDGMRGFTEKEWQALRNAKEQLGLG